MINCSNLDGKAVWIDFKHDLHDCEQTTHWSKGVCTWYNRIRNKFSIYTKNF